MEIEKYLRQLRGGYEETEPTIDMKLYGWERLMPKLNGREKPIVMLFYRLAYIGVAVLVLSVISLGIYKTADASLPGTPLYPVKLFSEEIINRTEGNNQASIDNRAEEIVALVEKDEADEEKLKEVVRQYSEGVQKAPVKDEEFQRKLEDQHKEFEKTVEDSPEHEEDLDDAIKASETRDSERSNDSSQNRSEED